ncbi:hypothetical protein EBB07_11585 [Paenibacillaceae bacterium]|nr:hypothetical protein EBB07_11585 [Paenibacillaceae bacterium]
MSLKKSPGIVLIFILILSVIMNMYQFTTNKNSKSKSNGIVEVYFEEKHNIEVSVSKISNVDDVIEFVVDVNGLDKDKVYTISLGSDNGSSGVMLSQGNTFIRVGELVNETQFIPYDTRLNFWTTHPKRVLNYSNLYMRIADKMNSEIIFKMEV